jgi:hypothetical protein
LLATEQKAKKIEVEKAQAELNELLAKAKVEEKNGDDISGFFNSKKKKQFYQNALSFYQKAVIIAEKYNFDQNELAIKMQLLNKKLK